MHFRQIANCLKMNLTGLKFACHIACYINLYTTLIVFNSVVISSAVKILKSRSRDWLKAKHKTVTYSLFVYQLVVQSNTLGDFNF